MGEIHPFTDFEVIGKMIVIHLTVWMKAISFEKENATDRCNVLGYHQQIDGLDLFADIAVFVHHMREY